MGKRAQCTRQQKVAELPGVQPAPGSKSCLAVRYGWMAALVAVFAAVMIIYASRSLFSPPASLTSPAVEPMIALASAYFVSEQSCAGCHAAQYKEWQGSHHALAMQEMTAQTVLGDFNDTRFSMRGALTRFFRRGNNYMVNTEGPNGKPADYAVKYVFGITPLQQYLLELPGGRLQALSVAWDTQNKRWFHLYPNENINHRDELHWTKPSQNWNLMCAECHSTGLKKNYNPEQDRYATTFHQINVGCQGCHGPASLHLRWVNDNTKSSDTKTQTAGQMGFQVNFEALDSQVQIEACARCHSRRSAIAPEYTYGRRLLDTHLPALLDEPLYYADGQIKDEVYVYGSFLQSKMAAKGVRCSDCHNPHTARLKAKGNTLCIGCHNATGPTARADIDTRGMQKKDYDSRAHHFHEPGTPGSGCIDCHAPKTVYMVVDPRADHSFRIPRPDLTEKIATPNACNGCHRDKSPQWAVRAIQRAHPQYQPLPHYGVALAAGRAGKAGAVQLLAGVIENQNQPAIIRASALELLSRYPGEVSNKLITAALKDPDPLVRRTAVNGFQSASPEQRHQRLARLLTDAVYAVRIEAARLLAPVSLQSMGEANRQAFNTALAELEASYRANLDSVEGRINFGNLYLERGQIDLAETAYRSTLNVDPVPVTAIVNLADFYRATRREAEAEQLLRDGLLKYPHNPALSRSLALSLVRQKRKAEALQLLKQDVKLTGDTELAYLYAVALHDSGRSREAIRVLENALPQARGDRNILIALSAFNAQSGNMKAAAAFLKQLAEVNPADPALSQGNR